MAEEETLESLRNSIVNLDFEGVEKSIKKAVRKKIPPARIADTLSSGMRAVGERFENKEYFLSELIVAGEIAKEALKALEPYLKKERIKSRGKVVIATVEGDIHDIGKNLIAMMLSANGLKVIDLGIDVPAGKIVEAVEEYKPQIVGLSALLTITMVKMDEVVKTLEKEGLRESVKIIVGGAPVTEEFAKKIGADHRATDAVEGVDKCLQWTAKGG